jgi:hypothetical protein
MKAASNSIQFYGEVAERSKASVLKTEGVKASGGSNPSLSSNLRKGGRVV